MHRERTHPAEASVLNVAVLGLGLIGGSVGLAARASGTQVVGFDPDAGVLARAVERGAIDRAADEPAEAVMEAEVVVAAAPIGALAQTVKAALRHAPPECAITDVGSTKRALLAELGSEPGTRRFLGGHPLAGSELGGIEHARADLFQGAFWCLMPTPEQAIAQRIGALVEGFGAKPVVIDPETHDQLMARISHLPHVLANVLVSGVAGMGTAERALAAGGPSFRDATRVAGASSTIWTDIYLSNADLLAAAIDEAMAELELVRDALGAADASALTAWNERAKARRQSLLP